MNTALLLLPDFALILLGVAIRRWMHLGDHFWNGVEKLVYFLLFPALLVNAILKTASEGALKGILTYQTEPLVSIDFNHNPASSNFDSTLTKVSGRLVKVSSWYDNEWGFSNRMLDTTVALMNAK